MHRPFSLILLCLACVLGGCGPEEAPMLVPSNPFGPSPPAAPISKVSFAPPDIQLAARVDTLGRNLLAANPQIGLKPLFRTIGAPQPEIFHRGTAEIVITEGLVRQCPSDGQLAAVLCNELGKMVSERQVLASPRRLQSESMPMPELRPPSDSGGDLTYLAELAPYDAERRRILSPPRPPDPQVLARIYLAKAGFGAGQLDTVAPLLQGAAGNNTFEQQAIPPAQVQLNSPVPPLGQPLPPVQVPVQPVSPAQSGQH